MNHQEILARVLKKGIDQAEVYLSSSQALKIDVHDQQVESVEEIRDSGCGIRIIKDKKLGFAYTSDFDEDVLEETIVKATANAANSEADEFHNLPVKQPSAPLDLVDDVIDRTSVAEKTALALKTEAAAYQADKRVKITEKVTYSDSSGEVWIANSNGVDAHYQSNSCGIVAQVIATHNGEMEYGFGIGYVKKFAELDPEAIGQESAKEACQLLGAKSIQSQKMPIIFDPVVGIDLLEVLAAPLSSEAVQKGKSLFAGKLSKQVGSKVLKIIDNGRLAGAIGSAPFDDEGVPTQETILIGNGILQNFLFNTYTANKGKAKSTGNASRGSFKGLPGVGSTNLYIAQGTQTQNSLLRTIKKGLLITRVMGIHTANPISGEFSVGASGIMIENGELTYPVRGVTIAGNLVEMLEQVEAVGSDLRFIGSTGSPSLLISNISVSGH